MWHVWTGSQTIWKGTMVAAKVIPAPSVNQKMIDNKLSVLSKPYSLLNSGCLQELQSSQFVVVVIPFSVIIITNLVDGFNLDEWLFAHRSEKVYLKVIF